MCPSKKGGWFAQNPGVLSSGRNVALTPRGPEPSGAGGARGGEAAPLNHALISPAPVPAGPALRVQFCFRLQGEANKAPKCGSASRSGLAHSLPSSRESRAEGPAQGQNAAMPKS